jgi:hypothetical protein
MEELKRLPNDKYYNIRLQYCNFIGPPSYVWSVVDRNVVMRRISVPKRKRQENIIHNPKEKRKGKCKLSSSRFVW